MIYVAAVVLYFACWVVAVRWLVRDAGSPPDPDDVLVCMAFGLVFATVVPFALAAVLAYRLFRGPLRALGRGMTRRM